MLNLTEMFDSAAFTLDGRSIEQTLQNFKEYVSLIPFENGDLGQMFFPLGDDDIRILAARYRTPELGDGQLPPQQAFLLAFLRQMATPRALLNGLPAQHRQLYYRDLLGLQLRTAQPDQVALSFVLSPNADEQLLPAGTLLDGGQDSRGQPLQYLLDQPLQANIGRLYDVRWVRPADAGQVSCVVQSGEDLPFPESGVRLFAQQSQDQAVATGRVIAAEVLALSSGQRTLTVTFAAAPGAGELSAAVSAEKGWLTLPSTTLTANDVVAVFILSADQPPIVPPMGLDGFTDAVPLLKLSRANGIDIPEVISIKAQIVLPADIAFSVPDGATQPDQACLPFGAEPLQGACVRLMAPDWCCKSQEMTVTLIPTWQGLPEVNFNIWYAGYTTAPTNNDVFKVNAQAYTASGWEDLEVDQSLFVSSTNAPEGTSLTLTFTDLPCDVSDSADPADWVSHLRLVLGAQTFLHQEYWQMVSAGTEITLNPPYTPQWAGLDISYSSTQTVDNTTQYRLTPFGHQPAEAELDAQVQLQLYLGFEAMQPGQQLSLYWKLQSPQPLDVDWQFLNQSNRWASLNADVLDSTGGLFESGLWSATLPADAGTQAAQMPPGYHWLRGAMTVTMPGNEVMVSDYPQLQGLLANAMTATLDGVEAVAANHFDQPLPAGSVTQTVEPVYDLDSVLQPWSSHGGQGPEALIHFNARVARQLLHRGRALRRDDLKTLLLEQFPEVYTASLPSGAGTPGEQILTVIPAPGGQDNTDSRRPMFNPARLERMQQAMQQRTSPWATLTVKNPVYIDVAVAYDVEFESAISQDFGEARLKQALDQRYIPWAVDDQALIDNGNQLDYYQVLAFIQQQPYVKKVISLFLNGGLDSVSANAGEVLVLGYFSLEVSTLAGSGETGMINDSVSAATFRAPHGLAVDNEGVIYVADRDNHCIRKITPDGMVSTMAGTGSSGSENGVSSSARFNSPVSVAVDDSGNVYVGDRINHRIRKIAPDGTVSTLAGSTAGFADGEGTAAKFNNPYGVAVDSAGNVYVGDKLNNRIRKITPDGKVTTLAGNASAGSSDGLGSAASFHYPLGVAVDRQNNVYVVDSIKKLVRKITQEGLVSTLTRAVFNAPVGVSVSHAGELYIADTNNNRICKVMPDGGVLTWAGSGVSGWADGRSSTAQFKTPSGVAVDQVGAVYVADQGNQRIRKIEFEDSLET